MTHSQTKRVESKDAVIHVLPALQDNFMYLVCQDPFFFFFLILLKVNKLHSTEIELNSLKICYLLTWFKLVNFDF